MEKLALGVDWPQEWAWVSHALLNTPLQPARSHLGALAATVTVPAASKAPSLHLHAASTQMVSA